MPSLRRAFTLIELLTVIAIIAILAALLFPVFGRVREQTRKTSCMSNMHALYVAYSLFRQDNNRAPCMLLGIAERTSDNFPWQPSDGQNNVVPAANIHTPYLYPAYVKNIEIFHCPDNLDNDMKKTTDADYSNASPKAKVLSDLLDGHT